MIVTNFIIHSGLLYKFDYKEETSLIEAGWGLRKYTKYVKELKNGKLKLSIDRDSRVIKAYKRKGKGFDKTYAEVSVKPKWVKDIEKFIVIEMEGLTHAKK